MLKGEGYFKFLAKRSFAVFVIVIVVLYIRTFYCNNQYDQIYFSAAFANLSYLRAEISIGELALRRRKESKDSRHIDQSVFKSTFPLVLLSGGSRSGRTAP